MLGVVKLVPEICGLSLITVALALLEVYLLYLDGVSFFFSICHAVFCWQLGCK